MSEDSEIFSGNLQHDNLIIRKAKPDLEEGLVFAWFFDVASEGFFKSLLGRKPMKLLQMHLLSQKMNIPLRMCL